MLQMKHGRLQSNAPPGPFVCQQSPAEARVWTGDVRLTASTDVAFVPAFSRRRQGSKVHAKSATAAVQKGQHGAVNPE
jgi:hypothetical protein